MSTPPHGFYVSDVYSFFEVTSLQLSLVFSKLLFCTLLALAFALRRVPYISFHVDFKASRTEQDNAKEG